MATIKKTLMDLFELEKLPPEKAAEMVERMAKLVFQAVLVRVLPTLSEKYLAEYEKIADGKEGAEVLFQFFIEKVPNFEKMIAEEAEGLREELALEFKTTGL